MKTAIVHDYFTQCDGPEKVAEELMRMFPAADLHAIVALQQCMPSGLAGVPVRTSWMQKLPGMSRHHGFYSLLYPMAISSLDLSGYDLVLTSSSGYAKGVQVNRDAIHVCYCHTPVRWARHFENSLGQEGMGKVTRLLLPHFLREFRQWDSIASRQPDHFIASSETVAAHIRLAYGRIAEVIHPPIDLYRFRPSLEQDDYYVVLARLGRCERIDLAIQACNLLGCRLLVIGDGPDRNRLMANAGPSVSFLPRASEAEVGHHVGRCRALIIPGEEDVSRAPLEVAAAGRPTIALRAGGASEIIVDGVTGVFFEHPRAEDLAAAILRSEQITWSVDALRGHAGKFRIDVFQARLRAFLTKVGAPVAQCSDLPLHAPEWHKNAAFGVSPAREGISA